MEAWLKFRAPGITVELGLGIGQLVFTALNRVEWVLASGILASVLLSNDLKRWQCIFFLLPLLVLILQSYWLLPALDQRATAVIRGGYLLPSNLHFYYVAGEIIKVISLFVLGIKLFRTDGPKTTATDRREVPATG